MYKLTTDYLIGKKGLDKSRFEVINGGARAERQIRDLDHPAGSGLSCSLIENCNIVQLHGTAAYGRPFFCRLAL